MNDGTHDDGEQMTMKPKLEAARELLESTKRTLQIVDERLATLAGGRQALELASDVASEHRVAWLGVTDDLDGSEGIFLGTLRGFANLRTGTIRNEEDAAFVCTQVMVAFGRGSEFFGASSTGTLNNLPPFSFFEEGEYGLGLNSVRAQPMLRLTDGNTGRSLITGMTQGPLDRDRGFVPFSYVSSFRSGLGSNFKNKLFSEFTIPRAGTIKVEVANLSAQSGALDNMRAAVALFGFKVYGA